MRGAPRSARINGERCSNRAAALLAFGPRATFTATTAAFAAIAATTAATTPTTAIAAPAVLAAALIFAFAPGLAREIAGTTAFAAISAATRTAALTTPAAMLTAMFAAMTPLSVIAFASLFRGSRGRGLGGFFATKEALQPAHEATGFLFFHNWSALRLPRRARLKLAFVARITGLTRFARSATLLVARIGMLTRPPAITGLVRTTFAATFRVTALAFRPSLAALGALALA